jgi:hypothetical protein
VQGVIAYQQPLPFIRAVKVSLGIEGRRVRVQVPRTASPHSPTDIYEITQYAHEIPIGVGQERHDAVVKVVEAEQRRIRRSAARQYRQTWFDGGQREKVVSFLSRAIRESQIVSVHAVPRTQIAFTILTSRLAFESEYAAAIDALQASSETENSAEVATEIERLGSFTRSLAPPWS